MTPNEKFIDAIDILNKRAYNLVDQNAKGWAKVAYKNGLISLEDCSRIEQFVDLRNAMGHGGMKYINVTEEEVRLVNRYIEIMTNGKAGAQKEEETPAPQPKKVEEAPKSPAKAPDLSISGICTKGASVKLNNVTVDLKNVKSTCCDWGDDNHWPSLEIMLRTNKIVTITYNDEATDIDGDSPEYYCGQYNLYYEEDGQTYYDYLSATRKMLQNDIRRIFDKCDKSSIFLDGLIVNAKNMSDIKANGDLISIRLYDGTILETQYTINSSDHNERDIKYYVEKDAFTVTVDSKIETEYSFAINNMLKTDFKYAEDTFIKVRSKRR
ncbi:MAG: hypothetical protein IJ400_07340 [Clostridia bacterium]|nr:hypothetical protein [Clostridia bacterium]